MSGIEKAPVHKNEWMIEFFNELLKDTIEHVLPSKVYELSGNFKFEMEGKRITGVTYSRLCLIECDNKNNE